MNCGLGWEAATAVVLVTVSSAPTAEVPFWLKIPILTARAEPAAISVSATAPSDVVMGFASFIWSSWTLVSI
jgi:hypothetical protein